MDKSERGTFVFAVLAVVFMIGVGFVAYHYRGITAGVVIERRFFPEHYETRYSRIQIGDNNYIDVPYDEHIPDRWTILIRGKNGSGVEVQSRLDVSPREYETIKVGDVYGIEAEQ